MVAPGSDAPAEPAITMKDEEGAVVVTQGDLSVALVSGSAAAAGAAPAAVAEVK